MLRIAGLTLSTRVVASFAAALPLFALATRATRVRSSPPPPARAELRAGEQVSYVFRASPTNSAGIRTLDELRGRPVLIDFWGRR